MKRRGYFNCDYRSGNVSFFQNGYYVTDEDKFQSEYALIFYEQLKALDEKEVTVILNSRFSKVEKRTDWGDHLLPLGFFDSNHVSRIKTQSYALPE